ncbi:MAG: TetR/AcrR family transcriptional regulator [Deltaproteobacteria bacterium]|nr:TetR/AcrR family transcriptional regulator [Deltaproteobacteria bacterium]
MKQPKNKVSPPGRIKIVRALKQLLVQKDFNSITTAEIAKVAGVTEGLIYKYFNDKRDLLYKVLLELFEMFLLQMKKDLSGIEGALNKLRKIIQFSLYWYDRKRVFTRILLIEARNSPDFYKSDAYQKCVREYSKIIIDIINEGIENGEIQKNIKPSVIRQVIQGSIEHACLPAIIFDRKISPKSVADDLCSTIFMGIKDDQLSVKTRREE